MTVGDPKKAIVLAVIALVVVCAAVFRLMPSAPAPVAKVPDAATAPAGVDPLDDEVAESVSIDPFSHPDLAQSEAAPKKDTASGPPAPPKARAEFGIEHGKTKLGKGFEPLPPVGPTTSGGDIAADAGIEFRVDAVVRSDDAMALVSIGPYNGIAVRVGTILNKHVTIIEIKAGSVVIEASGKRHEVAVGAGVTL
jgi:hypothetical protein